MSKIGTYYKTDWSLYFKPLIIGFVMPIVIGLVPVFYKPLLFCIKIIFLLILLSIPPFILCKIIYDWSIGERTIISSILKYIRPIPSGLVYNSDLKKRNIPFATLFFILSNTYIFFVLPKYLYYDGAFPPFGISSPIHFGFSIISHAFLHADFFHLMGNMFFLWAFGSVVEPRIGSIKYLATYFLCIFISSLSGIILLNLQFNNINSSTAFENYHSIGASGAISGIMALFVVRCFFARVTFSFPILFLPFLSMPLRLQGAFLVALFFMMDVRGSVWQYNLEGNNINYWSHIGGYICGFIFGYLMKFHKAAAEESVYIKAERLASSEFNTEKALYTYGQLIAKEPENETALLYSFKKYQLSNIEKATEYFCKLLEIYTQRNMPKAIALVDECFPKFMNSLPGDVLLKIGVYYFRKNDLKKARICLKLAKNQDGPWQAKAMLKLSDIYLSMDVSERAISLLNSVMSKYPNTSFHEHAKFKLSSLNKTDSK